MNSIQYKHLYLCLAPLLIVVPACDSNSPAHDAPSTAPVGRPFRRAAADPVELAPVMPRPTATLPADTGEEYLPVTLDRLSCFEYVRFWDEKPGKPRPAQLPDAIQRLDGRKIAVTGYVRPYVIDEESKQVSRCLLVKDPLTCCYGRLPNLHEYIDITMPDGTTFEFLFHVEMRFQGPLEVRENIQNGWATRLYSMTPSHVEAISK